MQVTCEDVHWSEEDIERNKPQSSLGYYVYDITSVPEETTADCNVTVTVTDDVANTRVVVLDDVVKIDNTKPTIAESLDVSQIKHLRIPFGAPQNQGVRAQYLVPLDTDAKAELDNLTMPLPVLSNPVEPIKLVRVYNAASGGTYLGEMSVSFGENSDCGDALCSASETPVLKLVNAIDSPAVYLSAVDAAGNESEERLRPVGEVVANTYLRISTGSENQTGYYAGSLQVPVGAPKQKCFQQRMQSTQNVCLTWKGGHGGTKRSLGT